VQVKGQRANHIFDFVSYPSVRREPIAIKILKHTYLSKGREYGFLVYDIEKTYFERWLRVAIMTKADRWTKMRSNS